MVKYFVLWGVLLLAACEGAESKIEYTDDGWAIYGGLEWSPRSETRMEWQETMNYCEAMGAQLPNIGELRKIIIDCPTSTYGGACKVSDPDCLRSDCFVNNDCRCSSEAESYSALGDISGTVLWSSSIVEDDPGCVWEVNFCSGIVQYGVKNTANFVRCVR